MLVVSFDTEADEVVSRLLDLLELLRVLEPEADSVRRRTGRLRLVSGTTKSMSPPNPKALDAEGAAEAADFDAFLPLFFDVLLILSSCPRPRAAPLAVRSVPDATLRNRKNGSKIDNWHPHTHRLIWGQINQGCYVPTRWQSTNSRSARGFDESVKKHNRCRVGVLQILDFAQSAARAVNVNP